MSKFHTRTSLETNGNQITHRERVCVCLGEGKITVVRSLVALFSNLFRKLNNSNQIITVKSCLERKEEKSHAQITWKIKLVCNTLNGTCLYSNWFFAATFQIISKIMCKISIYISYFALLLRFVYASTKLCLCRKRNSV